MPPRNFPGAKAMIEPSPANFVIPLASRTAILPHVLLFVLFGTTFSKNVLLLFFLDLHYQLTKLHLTTPNPNPNHQLIGLNPN
jgi:hypothetical protein